MSFFLRFSSWKGILGGECNCAWVCSLPKNINIRRPFLRCIYFFSSFAPHLFFQLFAKNIASLVTFSETRTSDFLLFSKTNIMTLFARHQQASSAAPCQNSICFSTCCANTKNGFNAKPVFYANSQNLLGEVWWKLIICLVWKSEGEGAVLCVT